MLRNNFFPCLTAICVVLTLVFLPTQTAFANEEAENHNHQGNEYYNSGNYEVAVNEYTAAIKLEEKAIYYRNRGTSYFKWKKYAEAEKDLKRAVELDEDNAVAYGRLALVYRAQGKNEDAKKYFVEAGMRYHAKKEYEESISDFSSAIRLDDKDIIIYDLRGYTYFKAEKYDEALADFNKAIQLDKNFADAYSNRASVYLKQGKNDQAKKDFLQAGNKYFIIKSYDAAKKEYNRAIELDKDYGEAYFWLGQIENRLSNENLSNWQEAIDKFDEAIHLGFAEDYVYGARGYAKYKMKDYQAAIKDFDKAIEIDVTHADAYKWRGETYFNLTTPDYEKARNDFKKYLELDEKNLDEETKQAYEDKIEQCEKALKITDTLEQVSEKLIWLGIGEVDKPLIGLFFIMVLYAVLMVILTIREGTLKHVLNLGIIIVIIPLFLMLTNALGFRIYFIVLAIVLVVKYAINEIEHSWGMSPQELVKDLLQKIIDWLGRPSR